MLLLLKILFFQFEDYVCSSRLLPYRHPNLLFMKSFFWLLVCACQKGLSINAFNTMPATISLWVATESTSTCLEFLLTILTIHSLI